MYNSVLDSHSGAAGLLQTTLDPANYNTVPPNLFNQPSFTKNVSVSGNWLVGTATGTVKDNSGLVIWNVQRGIADIKRYGFLNATTAPEVVTQATGSGAGLNAPTSFPGEDAVGNTVYTMTADLILPIEDAIDIAPDLGQDFSITRPYAGRVMVVSDTVPIGSTALAGRFAAGVISDLRDMEAKIEQFNESDLVQQSFTGKDGLKQVRAMDGIVTLLGADLPPLFSAPDRAYITDDGSTGMSQVFGLVTTPIVRTLAAGVNQVLTEPVFITPRRITALSFTQISPAAETFNCTVLNVDNLPPDGRLAVDVKIRRDTKPQSVATDLFQIQANLYHLYGSAAQDGTVKLYWGSKTSNTTCALVSGGNITINSFNCTIDVEPENRYSQYMYLGTMLILEGENLSASPSAGYSYDPLLDITVYAKSLYNSGKLGPSRVIRWDNFSNGQEIKLDGLILAQCVPEGSIAPYVAPTAQLAQVAFHLNIYSWLNALYNGDSPVRRNWRGPEYMEFLRNYVEGVTHAGLEATTPKDQVAAQAAGLISSKGSNVLSSVFGQPIGNASGGALSVMGMGDDGSYHAHGGQAAGMFGSSAPQFGSAAPQFGSAAPQFGESAGQFGLVSRGLAAGEFGASKRARIW